MKIKQTWFLTLLISAVVIIEGLTLLHKPKVTIQKDYFLREDPVQQGFPVEVVTEAAVVSSRGRLCNLLQQSSAWENRTVLAELDLELLGTAIGNVKDPIAFIKDLETGKQGMYKQGNVIKDAKIISIAMGEVVVDREGHREVLKLSNRARAWANMDESDSSSIIAISGDKIVVNKRSAIKEAPKIYNTWDVYKCICQTGVATKIIKMFGVQ